MSDSTEPGYQAQRYLELRLRFTTKLAGIPAATFERQIRFGADAAVSDLLSSVSSELLSESDHHPMLGLHRTVIDVVTADGNRIQGGGFLPANARIADCGLIDGAELSIRVRQDELDLPLHPIDLDEPDTLVLIDERGTHRGRMTALPLNSDVVIGSVVGNVSLPIDDLVLGESRIVLISRGTHIDVRLEPTPATVLLSGERIRSAQAVLTPGATLGLCRSGDEDPAVQWSVTTTDALRGQTAFGKIRLEPTARPAPPAYEALSERHRRIGAKPTLGRMQPLPWETLAASIVVSAAFAILSNPWMLLLSPVLAIPILGSTFRSRRQTRRDHEHSLAEWWQSVDESSQELTRLVGVEEQNAAAEAPSTSFWIREAYRRYDSLWVRNFADPDFLRLRLGIGHLASRYQVAIDAGVDTHDPEFQERVGSGSVQLTPEAIRPNLFAVPATISLREHNVGLIGPSVAVRQAATDLILQLVCAQSPGVLSLGALLPAASELTASLQWLHWLPHVTSASPIAPSPRITFGRRQANALLTAILETFRNLDVLPESGSARHHLALVVHEAAEIDQALLGDVLDAARGSVHVIWLGTGRARLAQPITAWLDLPPTFDASDLNTPQLATMTRTGESGGDLEIQVSRFAASPIRIATSLAPLFDPRVSGSSASLASRVLLSSIVPITTVQWLRGSSISELRVPIGMMSDRPLVVDLVRDGPHFLIGGTTGSGKSELLQTIVTSLALCHSPEELSFFLVDFKGGSTFADLADLPHRVGYVSDLDGPNVERSLAFLQAEIRRRMQTFSEYGNAKDYETYRNRVLHLDEESVLPRLVVLFDEFATLVQDFGQSAQEAVIDIAQRGRSLGVHLVLATQRPTGDVVSGKVRANVRGRIALQTLSRDDSQTVLDAPDAALIPRDLPGRAFLRLEGSSLTEFQSAFSGEVFESDDERSTASVRLGNIGGKPTAQPAKRAAAGSSELPRAAQTEMAAALGSIAKAAAVFERPQPDSRVLYPPLEAEPLRRRSTSICDSDAVVGAPSSGGIRVGLRDLPRRQVQEPYEIDLTEGLLAITGPIKSGKTWSLQLVAESWLQQGPGDVTMIDAGGDLTKLCRERRFYWSSTDATDAAGVTRQIDQLAVAIGRPGRSATGRRLLLIDGLDRVMTTFELPRTGVWFERFKEIIRYGRSAGVSVAVSSPDATLVRRLFESNLRWLVELTANYEKHHVNREEWLPGFGLTRDGELVQMYGLDELPATTEAMVHTIPTWTAPGWDEIVAATADDDAGYVALGHDDVANDLVTVDLADGSLLITGGKPDARRAAYTLVIAQLTRQLGGPILEYAGQSKVDLAWPTDLVAEIRNNVARIPGRVLYDKLVAHGCSRIGKRLVVGIPVGDLAAGDPQLAAALQELQQVDLVTIIWTSSTQNGRGSIPALFRSLAHALFVAPNSMSEVSEGSVVTGVPLEHRPRAQYADGQTVLQSNGRQQFVWLPRPTYR